MAEKKQKTRGLILREMALGESERSLLRTRALSEPLPGGQRTFLTARTPPQAFCATPAWTCTGAGSGT